MEIRFDGQVVLVTGASTGIGAAVAKAFGASGAQVIVHYNNSAAAARSVADAIASVNGSATLVQADVTKPNDIQRLVDTVLEKFARIDVLVNNAGGLVERNPVDTIPDEIYERIMNLNVRSIFQMCKLVIPVMKRQGRGNIINVTSVAARTGGGGGSVIYAAAKGAVVSFTRGLARELAGYNIRVNALSPGLILTPFHERWTPPAMMETLIKSVPMGRAGTAEECVGAVLFLASDQMSSYVTGQVIEVNGGMLMR
ncbi:MAG: glucose 1-dehydrogenase [Anaerolineae bacterium]|nr:glucose 1-dehydrogenase [Anaerolineae bacterium]MDW8069910.1 glucose 1-dehydrogenase [Anaerolineae bacterium]